MNGNTLEVDARETNWHDDGGLTAVLLARIIEKIFESNWEFGERNVQSEDFTLKNKNKKIPVSGFPVKIRSR